MCAQNTSDNTTAKKTAPVSANKRSHANPRRRGSQEITSTAFSGDSVHLYLKEIGRTPLLNAAQEVDLAMKMEAGRAAAATLEEAESEGVELDRRKKRRLRRIKQVGLDAKQALTEANLRLVVFQAKRYVNFGVPLLDLIQEGNLGLIRAVEKFEYKKGFKFSTYATWWIKQAITRSIADQSRTIRIPVHMAEIVNKIARAERKLTQRLTREPTIEEISEEIEIPANRVREVKRLPQVTLALESPIGEEDDSQLGDIIEDKNAIVPFDAASSSLLHEALGQALDNLSERERDVITMRFGLEDESPRTLEELGRKFGVTQERIRQIESRALINLRHFNSVSNLKCCLDN